MARTTGGRCRQTRHGAAAAAAGFTLPELLVVIGIVGLLVGLLLPVLSSVWQASRRATCASNQRQIGAAIMAYAADYDRTIPYGPTAAGANAGNFYPSTGIVTSLLSVRGGAPVGLGLLLKNHLGANRHVLFCPAPDHPVAADDELARVGTDQAQGNYYYRHGSSTTLAGDEVTPPTTRHIRLRDLGTNRDGRSIRALVMDQNYVVHPSLAAFDVRTRTNHGRRTVNVLYADGHVAVLDNAAGRYTVEPGGNVHHSLHLILRAFERADEP